jgi:hypothetical protein
LNNSDELNYQEAGASGFSFRRASAVPQRWKPVLSSATGRAVPLPVDREACVVHRWDRGGERKSDQHDK